MKHRRKPSKKHEMGEVVISDLGQPRLPLPVRTFNYFGKFFNNKKLTADHILREARKRTGLHDVLNESSYPYRKGLEKLISDYNDQKSHLTKFGRLCMRSTFIKMMANNLIIADRIKKYPEILSERIHDPVFIVGPPRTGSSHLHDTLSRHPAFRTPKHFELLRPVMKEEYFESPHLDPRKLECDVYVKTANYVRPYLPLLHDFGSTVSEEDIFVLGITFRSHIFGPMFPCKEYMQWLGETDHTPAYKMLKLVLQLLQWQDGKMGLPRRRWLLKSPDHSLSLPSLTKIFPDATIIQTHRDMSAVLPSYLNLVVYIQGIMNDRIDLKWTGEWWTAWFEFVLHRFVSDQSKLNGKVVNVLFRDLVSNDMSVVLNIFEMLGICVDEFILRRLEEYVTSHKRHSKGRVIYKGSAFGLKQQNIRDRFQTYHEAFGLLENHSQN